MKKSLFLVSVLLIVIAGTFSLKAQCPAGYTPHITYVTLNGCEYQIDVCIKCPIGPAPGAAQIQSITKLDASCYQTLTMQEVLDACEAQVFNWDFITNVACLDLDGPPCPDQSEEFIIKHWICWKAEMSNYMGDIYMRYTPCDYDAYCKEHFIVCYNGLDYVKTLVSPPTIVGTVNCELEIWEFTEPTEVGEISECYIYQTDCY